MTKKVLLIDDDSDDAELFQEALKQVDNTITCLSAEDGHTGLSLLREHRPNVIFLDINMPVMNGWDTLKAIKASADIRHIPVIMYSTSSYHKDIENAFALGSVCFFIKPFAFKELQETLGAIMDNLEAGSIAGVYKLKIKHLICPDEDGSHSYN